MRRRSTGTSSASIWTGVADGVGIARNRGPSPGSGSWAGARVAQIAIIAIVAIIALVVTSEMCATPEMPHRVAIPLILRRLLGAYDYEPAAVLVCDAERPRDEAQHIVNRFCRERRGNASGRQSAVSERHVHVIPPC